MSSCLHLHRQTQKRADKAFRAIYYAPENRYSRKQGENTGYVHCGFLDIEVCDPKKAIENLANYLFCTYSEQEDILQVTFLAVFLFGIICPVIKTCLWQALSILTNAFCLAGIAYFDNFALSLIPKCSNLLLLQLIWGSSFQ